MVRLIAALVALLPAYASADIVAYYTTGQSLYVRFDDASNTAANLTEGTGLKLGRYTVADAAIDTAGLGAGTFSARIFIGTAGAQASGDTEVAIVPEFMFNGTIQVTSTDEILAAIEEIEGGGGGTTQPRINREPAPGFTIQISRRTDGTYKCTRPIRLTAGAVDSVYVFIDMSPLFGKTDFVETVGTAAFSAGSITQGDDNGPRDTYAVVELDGTATAGEERTVTVPVTMESGTTVPVVFDVEVFE